MSLKKKCPFELTRLEDASAALADGRTTSVELAQAALTRIRKQDPIFKAFITQMDDALQQAERADSRIATEQFGPLTGIPIAVKDNICTRGTRTTCASRALENFVAPYDATAVEKLKAAGAVIIGKTNLDEFGMGGSTENSAFFPTLNPWDKTLVPGGSSGGSAAALAYGGALGALGTDTGGSIRLPAAFCGQVGIKPTYGLVSRWGQVAMASSLEQIGPMASSVRGCAMLLQCIAGPDPKDETAVATQIPDYMKGIDDGIEGRTIALPRAFLNSVNCDSAVTETLESACEIFRELGAKIVEVDPPYFAQALSAYQIICASEISANLARYDGHRFGESILGNSASDTAAKTRGRLLGPEVKRRILLGAYALSEGYAGDFYHKATAIRGQMRKGLEAIYASCDALLLPTAPVPPFAVGRYAKDPVKMHFMDVFTVFANLTGHPAISFPGDISDGLPIGLQMAGPPFSEEMLLRFARAYERATS